MRPTGVEERLFLVGREALVARPTQFVEDLVERIGLICAGLCVVTAMVSAFVPLTDDLTAYRHSMMTTCVLAVVTVVIFYYLRRKAR